MPRLWAWGKKDRDPALRLRAPPQSVSKLDTCCSAAEALGRHQPTDKLISQAIIVEKLSIQGADVPG